ncbi:MAG TPA: DNA ligase D [Gammaproteobacteria bacterium]
MLGGEVATKNAGKLETYRAKRNTERTPEPAGGSQAGSRRFVVQLHAARRRHYDFRLEWDGVLVSWAVPKGPSPNPADKRLAVHVEDHPVEYAGFEGLIPAGNYGAGAVIVWDRGQWLPLDDFAAGLESGKLLFELRGYKLRGRWTLVKTRRGANEWLLIKERDALASDRGTEDYPPESILSGRTVEALAAGDDRAAPVVRRLVELGAPRRRLDWGRLKPMLATAGRAFSRPGWVFEIKYDGYRLFAAKRDGAVTLRSRAGNDLTASFPEIADVVAALPYETFVIDGEAVVHDERGLPSFQRLQKRGRLQNRADIERASVELPATFYAFDLPHFEGFDLRDLPLLERKELLRAALPPVGPLRFSDHIAERGEEMFASVESMGLEGVVAKRADSKYVCRRSTDWVKVTAAKTHDFVVVGYTPPKSAGGGFGGLLLGEHRGGELCYAGRVGTGFSHRELEELRAALVRLPRAAPPRGAPAERGAVWVAGGPVVAVKYKQRTDDGVLRQPVFERVRDDKTAAECVAEEEGTLAEPEVVPAARTVDFTNLDKVLWPAEGLTKGDLIAYYERVARWWLPYLRDRPVVLTRYPDGIDGKSFFQKDAPAYVPGWMRLETMWSEHAQREVRYFVLDDVESLLYVANMATIPLHVWSSRVGSLTRPDWCILDLDPKGAPLADVVAIARYLRALCDDVGLPCYVKTSGSSGLHVLIPLGARYTYEQSRTLAELLALVTARALPDIATVARAVGNRGGKVYLDYLQNGHGKLLVAPFSVRALPGAPVSMPLEWRHVTKRLKLERFNVRTAPAWLEAHGDPLAPVLTESIDLAAVLEALRRRVQLDGRPRAR